MIECLHTLTSSSKMNIIEQLSRPVSPEEIARTLGMTRQAVDKHLKDLVKYGIVERMWVTGVRKPRIEFKISSLGTYFYDNLKSFLSDYRSLGSRDFNDRLKSLDLKLMKDEIDSRRYSELRKELENERHWFLEEDA